MAKKQKQIMNSFTTPLDVVILTNWFANELQVLPNAEANVIFTISQNLQDFVAFPKQGHLFFYGVIRKLPKTGQYIYPLNTIFSKPNPKGKMETMTNGPAVVAFEIAGGSIPLKGSGKGWSVHHLYSGDFPYIGRKQTMHAVKDGLHFTHTAGLVAVHPLAEAAAHEYACFSWFLRAKAFLLFNYDPDNVF